VARNSSYIKDRTVNRHRWDGRVYQGDWVNYPEGTRQNASVTSGERWPGIAQAVFGGTKE